ncbi:NUDIX domain-containing protein [Noviherbaspirillum cavernae]|uniref:NUDIX domain-containing protein n=2 Tax=Noviherbaspirillum cavernae TaxID=2320862 RepID=A0A418WWK1_9BURK|nr:NUDIX domain-containing protein [Noviherbaspirillum cavernae]
MPVRSDSGRTLLFVERAALRPLGAELRSVHLLGMLAVHAAQDEAMWLARRSPNKTIDPNLLDTLVGGGIGGDMTADETLVKEAWEEAGLRQEQLHGAIDTGQIRVQRAVAEGWHDELIHTRALSLPPEFEPRNQDGEVSEFVLLPLNALLHRLAETDDLTLDASCIICAYLMQRGLIGAQDKGCAKLRALIHATA